MGDIEVETPMDKRDFDDLWDVSVNRVTKRRHVIRLEDTWEIDFFLYDEKTYFALAEVELPENQLYPELIPDIISNNLLYQVPIEEQDRFSTKQLACVGYAKKLYKSLK